jgi:hypothetical protein
MFAGWKVAPDVGDVVEAERCGVWEGRSGREGGAGGVLIYASSTRGVHFLMVSPRGVYRTGRERTFL